MLLKAQAIAKSFGPVKVLTDTSIQINEEDSIGLIGINGAGKSTFQKILLREVKCDTGKLTRYTEEIISILQDILKKGIMFPNQKNRI